MALYLDYCASAPLDKRVLNVMMDVYQNHFGNADSRTHIFGTRAKEIVVKSRKKIAEILSIDPTEVIFTSGATESNNMAILGLASYGLATNRKHIVTSAIEHKAVLESVRTLEKQGFEVDYVSPTEEGFVDADAVLNRVRKDTLLVSIMHVNNETGVIQPIVDLGDELDGKNVLFHIDAAQSFGKLNDEIRRTKFNMLSISGHKIHGPQGIGAIVLRRKQYKRPPISPLLYGGQQEFGFRPGTTPVALVAGLAEASEIMDSEYPTILPKLKKQREGILEALAPFNCEINGSPTRVLPNVLNISVPGVDAEALFAALKDDYALSNGSACTSGSYSPSYVLQAMGMGEKRIAQALRVSWWDEPIDLTALLDYISALI